MRYFSILCAAFLLVAACQRELPGEDNLPAPDREDPGDAVPSPEPEESGARSDGRTAIENAGSLQGKAL